jgi:predicted nucleic acid-binding protein
MVGDACIHIHIKRGLNASTLWEWASGDALYACSVVRNTLTLEERLRLQEFNRNSIGPI